MRDMPCPQNCAGFITKHNKISEQELPKNESQSPPRSGGCVFLHLGSIEVLEKSTVVQGLCDLKHDLIHKELLFSSYYTESQAWHFREMQEQSIQRGWDLKHQRMNTKSSFFKLEINFFAVVTVKKMICWEGEYFSSLQKLKSLVERNSESVYPIYFYHRIILREPDLCFECSTSFANY